MKDKNYLYTLITGASKGLGKQFAIECARRKMNLILVSLPDENLNKLSKDITSTYQIKVSFRETDLTKRDAVKDLAQWLNENFSVNMIVNNAGIGGSRIFADSPTDYLENIIQLNISAMTLLTRLLLPVLKEQPKAFILNVSSLAAFSPVPYKTVYPASKAFIYNFTLGLRAELKDTNVSVSVLTPGPIMTNSDVSKRINKQSFYIKLSIMSAESIAQIAIKKLLRGSSIIIPGFMNRFNASVIRLVPVNFRIFVGTSIFKRELKKNQPNESIDNRSYRAVGQQSDQTTAPGKL